VSADPAAAASASRMEVIFACRRNRLGDIGLIRLGVIAAGHRLRIVLWPWAFLQVAWAALARLFGRRSYLIVSDKFPGDTGPARWFGRDCTRMLWNYADEWPAGGTRLPLHKVCFFREAGFDTDDFVFAPQPAAAKVQAAPAKQRQIVFIGDVTTTLSLPRGADWWRAKFEELRDAHGYAFYLHGEYEALLNRELSRPLERRTARLLAKNLLRLWIIEHTRQHFGERLVLVGSNWRRFGMASEPSLYSEAARLELYRSAVVNLDCGSKSGDGALYPRSSELITVAGGLLQVRCSNTEAIFGERAGEFSFATPERLVAALEARLSESEAARNAREEWLTQRLSAHGLLMQHSVERLLQHRDPAC